MTIKFIHPTAAQAMRVAAIVLVAADFVLTYANEVQALPGVPDWLAYLWPWVLLTAAAVHQLASTCGLTPDAVTQSSLASTMAEAKAVLAAFEAAKAGAPLPTRIPRA